MNIADHVISSKYVPGLMVRWLGSIKFCIISASRLEICISTAIPDKERQRDATAVVASDIYIIIDSVFAA